MESRNRILFCQSCSDFVYDYTLDRLRSAPPKDLAKTGRKRLSNEHSADDELYIRSNANKRPCARQGVRGLFNLGQTCYMNAILQTLLHDPLVNNYFLGNGHHPHECSPYECLGCAFTDAVADFNNYEKPEGFPALAVLMASWKQIPVRSLVTSTGYNTLTAQSMAGYYQHDAHEWYQFLIDRLHACTEGHSDNSEKACPCFFHRTFYGKLRSSVTCDKCGNVTRKDEPMIDLSLDVQIQAKKRAMGGIGSAGTPTLNGCLESFTSPEKLMADAYNCNGCGGTPQKATKQMQIKKLPAILCMQLKVRCLRPCLSFWTKWFQRFEHKSKASSKLSFSDKIEGRIDFPLSVNMLPYTTNPNSQRVDKSKYWYDLSSAVIHKGKLESGHYYAYCRQGDQVSCLRPGSCNSDC